MKAVEECNATNMIDLWMSYYRNNIEVSPCDKYTKYGGGVDAIHPTVLLVFLPLIIIIRAILEQ